MLNRPCNCSDPLGGAKVYYPVTDEMKSKGIVRAKKMDRDFILKTGRFGMRVGHNEDYAVEYQDGTREIFLPLEFEYHYSENAPS